MRAGRSVSVPNWQQVCLISARALELLNLVKEKIHDLARLLPNEDFGDDIVRLEEIRYHIWQVWRSSR